MPRAFSQVSFVILAGGKGSRLGGAAKGLIVIDGESLISRLVRLGSAFAETLIVSPDPAPYRAQPVRFVTEEARDAGPLAGMRAAAASARCETLLVVACDQPWVSPAALEVLLAPPHDAKARCFEVAGRWQPFPSRWNRAALLALNGDTASLTGALHALDADVLPEARLEAVDPGGGSVRSVNDSEDLSEAGGRLPADASRGLP